VTPRKRNAAHQLKLNFRGRGGARRGAGRKPNGRQAGVTHLTRPSLSRHHPVHVTLRVRRELPTLRTKAIGRLLFASFANARNRFGARLTHFSIQANHLHLIVEAASKRALSRAMQGLGIRVAKAVNRKLARRGNVLADRYHARALRTPLEVRRAVLYVINNYRRHLAQVGSTPPRDWADPFSSVDYFKGFRSLPSGRRARAEYALGRAPPVTAPRTWLLARGWQRRGLLSIDECPHGMP
jgi:REP element-mobilizing transposase RayT